MAYVKYEYEIQQYTGEQHGWELVATEETNGEAQDRLTEYRQNQPGFPVRCKKVRKSMKKYQVQFYGRLAGAQGIDYNISANVEAESEGDANIKLYDRYDHVMFAKFFEVPEFVDGAEVIR